MSVIGEKELEKAKLISFAASNLFEKVNSPLCDRFSEFFGGCPPALITLEEGELIPKEDQWKYYMIVLSPTRPGWVRFYAGEQSITVCQGVMEDDETVDVD